LNNTFYRPVKSIIQNFIITDGCARRGASGALNLKSALAGLNSFSKDKIL